MAQITAPNKDFTGDGPFGVAFVQGKGGTWNEAAIDWFVRKGYGVALDEFDTESTKRAAEGKSPRSTAPITGRASEDAAESAALTQAQRQDAYGVGVGTLLPPGHSITGAPAIDAGLPQLTHGQRQQLREYLDEQDAKNARDRNAQGLDAVADGSADKAVKAAAKPTRGRKPRKSSGKKSTRKKSTRKSSSSKSSS